MKKIDFVPSYVAPSVEAYRMDEESALAASGNTTESLISDDDVLGGSEGNETFTQGGSLLEW